MACICWWNCLLLLLGMDIISDACRTSVSNPCNYIKNMKTLDCTNIDMGHFKPEDIPSKIVVLERLYLRNTCLKTLQENVFSRIKDLWYLDMSGNYLNTLDKNVFKDLRDLLHLDLSNNKLIYLTDSDVFKSQGKLITLLLDNNSIRKLFAPVLKPLVSIKLLQLIGNSLTCDCNLRLTMLWCEKRKVVTNAICEYPLDYIGKPWTELNFHSCDKSKTTTLMPTTEDNATTIGWDLSSPINEWSSSSPTSEWSSSSPRSEWSPSSPATESNPTFETASETLSSSSLPTEVISGLVVGFLLLLSIGCVAVVRYWKKCKPSNIRDSNTLVQFDSTPNTDYYYYERVTGPAKCEDISTYAPKLPERPSHDMNSQCDTKHEEVYDYAEVITDKIELELDNIPVDEYKCDEYQNACDKAIPIDNNSQSKGHHQQQQQQQCTSEVIVENNYYGTEE